MNSIIDHFNSCIGLQRFFQLKIKEYKKITLNPPFFNDLFSSKVRLVQVVSKEGKN
jgi:hypothetical protein